MQVICIKCTSLMVKNFTQEPEPVHNWHKPQLDRNKHHWGWLSSSPIVRMQWNVTWPVWWCFLIEQVCCLNGVHKLDVSMCVCVCVCMYVCIHISDLPNDSQIYFPLKINIKWPLIYRCYQHLLPVILNTVPICLVKCIN